MKKFLKYCYFNIESIVCTVMFMIMLIVCFYQVILRFVFKAPNLWSEELARYLFIYIVFLSSSFAVLERKHVKIDALEKVWPGVTKKISEIIGAIIWIVFSAVLTYFSFIYVKDQVYGIGLLSIGLKGPMWGWWTAVPLGNALITIRLIICFIEDYIIKRPLVKPLEEKPSKKKKEEVEK